MDIEKILYIVCGVIPLLYFISYVSNEKKKPKKRRRYITGFITAIVIGLILLALKMIAFTFIFDEENKMDNNTTTTVTTTTTEEVTTTTIKKTNAANGLNRIEVPTGGVVLGKTSKGYEVRKVDGLYYIDGYLIANKTYNLPKDYSPGDLLTEVKTAANKMFAAAEKEKGYTMWAQSKFRSYSTQESLYNNYVKKDGKEEADTYSARPGYSEHQTGLAFDVCATDRPCINSGFDNTPEAKWLSENAYKYGFILRYVKGKTDQTGYQYESWHFRYVGTELAEILYNNGDWLTMEEYFGFDSSYDSKPIGE